MTNPILAINNYFESANVVTASSEATGYDKENAFDNLLSDYWQPNAGTTHTIDVDMGSAVSVDLFGFVSSDFYTMAGAKCELYWSNDGISWSGWGAIYPTTPAPKLKLNTTASHRYWRLQFDTTASQQPKIQHVYMGVRLEVERALQVGFAPMALGSENVPISSETTDGNFIGRSTKKAPIETKLSFDNITEAWIRANWPTIVAALEAKPFMVLTQPDDYTDEAAFCWTSKRIEPPSYTDYSHMQFSLNIKARIT